MKQDDVRRRICVVTGSRAEYGILRWILEDLRSDPVFELQVAATGMHLAPEFGLTARGIEEDGFTIDARVEMLLSSDTPVGVAKSVGLGVIGFADAFARLSPDLVVLLGDRFEILAAAQAAMLARIPIAHLHGGELTEGAVDESIRHAVTKMSSLHFVAAEPYRRRVIQLGEAPECVFSVGAPGLDALKRLRLPTREELASSLDFSLADPYLLVTYHPATLGERAPADAFVELLAALDRLPEMRVLFTLPNADADGRAIAAMVRGYAAESRGRVMAFVSLGQVRYLSALKYADAVVGNSSSGIIEAPSFGVPTVNLGDRQKGRLRAASVIDCEESAGAILTAIRKALSPAFRKSAENAVNPYGDGGASERIVRVLREFPLSDLRRKKFFDMPPLPEEYPCIGGHALDSFDGRKIS